MADGQPQPLNEESFFKRLAPFFEEIKAKMTAILGWPSLSRLRLVCIENSASGDSSHLYVSEEPDANLYLRDVKATGPYIGFSTDLIAEPYVYSHLVGTLQSFFLGRVVEAARPLDIANYVQSLLESNYRSVDREDSQQYIRLHVPNVQFQGEHVLFAISAYRLNIVVPLTRELKAGDISDPTADNRKVIVTNQRQTESFVGFDQVLGHDHLVTHFHTVAFVQGARFYGDVLNKTSREIFEIIDLLRTTGESAIYHLKRQLVTLDLSKGKAFQQLIAEFLTTCFGPCFESLQLKSQVPTRGATRVRDFIIVNNNPQCGFLGELKDKGVDLIIFDGKNYEARLTSRNIDTFRQYLSENRYFGDFGIILSRKGASKNCKETIFRNLAGEEKVRILVLDENDMLAMLENVDSGRSAVDVLEKKYTELLLQL